MAITDWPEGEQPRDNKPLSSLLRRWPAWRSQVKRNGRSKKYLMVVEVSYGNY
jgi:hypothetical protein